MSNTMNLTEEQAREMSMVDIAYEILQSTNKPYQYRELLQEIATIKGMSDEEMANVIAQLYTEVNIDGRFVCVGQGQWGLRRWYSIEKQEDGAEGFMSRDDEDFDDLDLLDEDEDDEQDVSDDYDLLGKDEDEDEDEDEDIDEDLDEDDEEDAEADEFDADFPDEELDDTMNEEFDELEDEEENSEEFVEEDEDF